MFIDESFRISEKPEAIHIAFLAPCEICLEEKEAELKRRPLHPDRMHIFDYLMETAYYLERVKPGADEYRACFGYIYEENNSLRRDSLFKRGGGKKDVNSFRIKDFGSDNFYTKLTEHQYYDHFNILDIDQMLFQPGYLPQGTTTWSYWKK